jgi:hypothetical protein
MGGAFMRGNDGLNVGSIGGVGKKPNGQKFFASFLLKMKQKAFVS